MKVNIADWDEVERAAAETVSRLGGIDVLVASAAITGPNALLWDYPVDKWRQVIDINVNGLFYCNRAVVPHMLKGGYGRIVNVASVAGKEGNPNASAYSCSKAAVIGLTKSLGKELATKSITVNAVTPAAVRTPIFDQMSQQHIDFMLSKIPMGRFGEVRGDHLAYLLDRERGVLVHHGQRVRCIGRTRDLLNKAETLRHNCPNAHHRLPQLILLSSQPGGAGGRSCAVRIRLGAARKRSRDWTPRVLNTDKNPAYGEAIAELKKEVAIPKGLEHRQAKYLNHRLESEHGKLKRLIRPTLGFQSMRTAQATIKGFEVMRMFKKGQFRLWIEAVGGTEGRFVNRLFGLYA